jgi:nicotinamidase-related amidase
MAKSALVIIDMLNDFVLDGAPLKVEGIENIVEPIYLEASRTRKEGNRVVYLCDEHDEDDPEFKYFPPHAVKGTKGSKIISRLKPGAKDILIKKKTYSGFYGTDLSDTLEKEKAREIKLCGCVLNICILFTAVDAFMRGYDVKILDKACASFSRADHDYMIRYFRDILKIEVI